MTHVIAFVAGVTVGILVMGLMAAAGRDDR